MPKHPKRPRDRKRSFFADGKLTDRDKLPKKTGAGNAVVPTGQSGSLVARGLEAVRSREKIKPEFSTKVIGLLERLAEDDSFDEAEVAALLELAEQGNGDAMFILGTLIGMERECRKTMSRRLCGLRSVGIMTAQINQVTKVVHCLIQPLIK
jgi:hypothetical protein